MKIANPRYLNLVSQDVKDSKLTTLACKFVIAQIFYA